MSVGLGIYTEMFKSVFIFKDSNSRHDSLYVSYF